MQWPSQKVTKGVLIKRCMEELNVDPKRYPPESISRQISDAKNQLLGPAEFREKGGPLTVAEALHAS